jgi:branched-chain amino acid transport system substrate-binding protein
MFKTTRWQRATIFLASVALTASACGSTHSKASSSGTSGGNSSTSSSASTTSSPPLVVGLVTSLTGPAGSTFTDVPTGAASRIDQQNAAGGVFGRKITLVTVDDASSTSQDPTAVADLVSKGALVVLGQSPFFFGGYRYLQQHGVPVVGGGFDGPEWGEQPNTNMFEFTPAAADPDYPQYTTFADFMKARGVTTVAAVGYGDTPSSKNTTTGFAFAAKSDGLKVGFVGTSLPNGSVDVGPTVLAMKQAGVNGLYMSVGANTAFALVSAAQQAGLNLKVALLPTGYGSSLLSQPTALAAAQGDYFELSWAPTQLNTPAVIAQRAAMKQFGGYTDIPSFGYSEGWYAADLAIRGLMAAGPNPTRASFIQGLQGVTNYNAGGLLANTMNFSLGQFGKAPATSCDYFVQLKGNQFVPVDTTPVCGSLIPNSNQA